MKKIFVLALIPLLAGMIMSSCGGAPTAPVEKNEGVTVTEGVMTTSVDNSSKPTGEIKNKFDVDTPAIYCSFKLNGVKAEDMIKVAWVYTRVEGSGKQNITLSEMYDIASGTTSSYYLAFYQEKPASGWEMGDYEVVISINNIEKSRVTFKIE